MPRVIQYASLADVQALAERTYAAFRETLFGPDDPSIPATLIVSGWEEPTANANAGYSPSRNEICIPVTAGDLEGHDALNADAWPVWKIDLVEELVHEYQDKVRPPVTDTARALSGRYGPFFAGPEHDGVFFSAVEVLASALKLEPDKLVRILMGELIVGACR